MGSDHHPEQDVEADLEHVRTREQGEAHARDLECEQKAERRGADEQAGERDLREPDFRHAIDDRAQAEREQDREHCEAHVEGREPSRPLIDHEQGDGDGRQDNLGGGERRRYRQKMSNAARPRGG